MDADSGAAGHRNCPHCQVVPFHQARLCEEGRITIDSNLSPFTLRNRFSGRCWCRRNYSFQRRTSRREGAVPERDDGVCLRTLQARLAGTVKGRVRRQAPSRQREPLKAVMEPAPAPPRPIPENPILPPTFDLIISFDLFRLSTGITIFV